MRKRVKVSVPKLIKEVIEKDIEYFNITKEKLCNIILQELGFEKLFKLDTRMSHDKNTVIFFNMTERNSSYFKNMLEENNETVEAEFLRRILSNYINLHPSIRERVVKKNIFNDLDLAIKKKHFIKISYRKEIINVFPESIERNDENEYNYLKAKTIDGENLYEIRDIEVLKIDKK